MTSPTALTINLKAPNAFFVGELSKIYILNAKLVGRTRAPTTARAGYSRTTRAAARSTDRQRRQSLSDVTVEPVRQVLELRRHPPDQHPRSSEVDQSSTEAADLKAGTADIALKLSSADAAAVDGAERRQDRVDQHRPDRVHVVEPELRPDRKNPWCARHCSSPTTHRRPRPRLGRQGHLMSGTLPPTMSCRARPAGYSQDLGQAKALLAQAGVTTCT